MNKNSKPSREEMLCNVNFSPENKNPTKNKLWEFYIKTILVKAAIKVGYTVQGLCYMSEMNEM